MGNSPGSSGRSTVLKDVSSRLPGCRGLEGEGRRLCSEGASLTRPSDDAYGVHECLYTQTKDKILPPSCGSEMSPGSSPGGTLGQSLNQPICCLSNPWPCAGGRDKSGEEAMAALGQMQGVLLGNKCPFIRPPFLHGLGECR